MVAKYNLSPEQKEEIVNLYIGGTSAGEIKDAYSIKSESTIYKILHDYNVPLRTRNHLERSQKIFENKQRKIEEEANHVDETLPERKTARKRFRVTLKVRLTFDSDTMEAAIAQAKGYNGFQEVLSVSRVG